MASKLMCKKCNQITLLDGPWDWEDWTCQHCGQIHTYPKRPKTGEDAVITLSCTCGNTATLSNDERNHVRQNDLEAFDNWDKQPFVFYGDYDGFINIQCNKCGKKLGPSV